MQFFRLLQIGSIYALFFLISVKVSALGVGDYQVKSYLNEPLLVEAPILDAQGVDPDTIKVELAHDFYFQLSKLEKKAIHDKLRFKVWSRDGDPYLAITTSEPVNEAFLKFITQFNWPNGRLLKEFTVLLDPPTFTDNVQVDSVQPANVGQVVVAPQATVSTPEYVEQAPIVVADPIIEQESVIIGRTQYIEEPETVYTPQPSYEDMSVPPSMRSGSDMSTFSSSVPQSVPQSMASEQLYFEDKVIVQDSYIVEESYAPTEVYSASGDYYVSRGETLWGIAQSVAPGADPTLTSIAILDKNPQAFVKGNINVLMAGAELNLPTPEEIQQISAARARKIFQEQSNPILDDNETQLAGEIEDIVEDEAPQVVETDQGEVVIATGETTEAVEESAQTEEADTVIEGALNADDLALLNSENEELTTNVAELESAVEKGESVVALQNQQISELEAQIADAEAQAEAAKPSFSVLEFLKKNLWYLLAALGLLLALIALLVFKRRRSDASQDELADLDLDGLDGADLTEGDVAMTEVDPMDAMTSAAPATSSSDVMDEVNNLLAVDEPEAAAQILEASLAEQSQREDYRLKLAQIYSDQADTENFTRVATPLTQSKDVAMKKRVEMMATKLGVASLAAAALSSSHAGDEDIVATDAEEFSEDDLDGFDFSEMEETDQELTDEVSEETIAEPEAEPSTDAVDPLTDDLSEISETLDSQLDETEVDPLFADEADLEVDATIEDEVAAIEEPTDALSFDEPAETVDAQPMDADDSFDPLMSDDQEAPAGEDNDVHVKIDLAEAYLDMGDPEGAKELLMEIAGQGSAAENERIQQLLNRC
ncbi:MAG: FimV/HubP family polar landmark protein [Pseudomonadota bacterium]|nr:FimV/HubP family polar landmark protein [Pseudomonadota bacterium]